MTVKKMTHCHRGHELTVVNTYVTPKTGDRTCKTCKSYRLFGANRETVIQRDGEKCLKCGMTREEHKKKWNKDITVDHIDRMGQGVPKKLKNNDLSNLQTLCLTCHAIKDSITRKVPDNIIANIMHLKGSLTNKEIAKLYNVDNSYVGQLYRGMWRKNITQGRQA